MAGLRLERHFSLETSQGEHYRGITINDNDRPTTSSPETSQVKMDVSTVVVMTMTHV